MSNVTNVGSFVGGKGVGFLNGADGKEWVWVMGDHKDDKSIEQILEDEAQEKAKLLAESEAEELRSVGNIAHSVRPKSPRLVG